MGEYCKKHGKPVIDSEGCHACKAELDTQQTFAPMSYGWICPVCGKALSPYTSVCNHGQPPQVTY